MTATPPSNGKRTAWVAAAIGVLTLIAMGSTILPRVLNVETREEARSERDIIRVELTGRQDVVDKAQKADHDAIVEVKTDLRRVREDVVEVKSKVDLTSENLIRLMDAIEIKPKRR